LPARIRSPDSPRPGTNAADAGPVGGHVDAETAPGVADPDHGAVAGGVLERVGQRFLDHPVGGEAGRVGQRQRAAVGLQLDRLPGAAGLLDQDHHAGDVVGDDIVQLARDPGPPPAAASAAVRTRSSASARCRPRTSAPAPQQPSTNR
jgi:hypothetical protein